MIKPQLRPTADQTFRLVADPADRNWDFVEILARSRREEQQGNIEAACNTRYHAVQRLEELLPESGEVILEWEDDNSQAALEVVYCSAIDHFLIGDWEMAAAMFEMLLELDPEDHLEAIIRLAYTYIAMEEYDSYDDVADDINDKSADKAILTLWSEFRRTGTLPAGEVRNFGKRFVAYYNEFRADEHPIDEGYLADIESERPSVAAQARELWLQTEHLWAQFGGFIEALRKA
jgi:tetratricopeptide (TPR) repeat protein